MNVFINFTWPYITLFINLMSTENKRKQLRIANSYILLLNKENKALHKT